MRRWWWQARLVREQLFALADEVAGYLPEVDEALATGKRGPHVRRFDLR